MPRMFDGKEGLLRGRGAPKEIFTLGKWNYLIFFP